MCSNFGLRVLSSELLGIDERGIKGCHFKLHMGCGSSVTQQQQAGNPPHPHVTLKHMPTMQRASLKLIQEHLHEDRAAKHNNAECSSQFFEDQNEEMRIQMSHQMHEQRVERHDCMLIYTAWEKLFNPMFEAQLAALGSKANDKKDWRSRWTYLWGALWAELWPLTQKIQSDELKQASEEEQKRLQMEMDRLKKEQGQADEMLSELQTAEQKDEPSNQNEHSSALPSGMKKPPWMSEKAMDILSAEQLAFFHKYGFVVIRGFHSQAQVNTAHSAAEEMILDAASALDDGKGEQAFGNLPEGSRSTWGRCTEPRMTQLFEFPENFSLVKELIGDFEFKHHPGPGFYTFAPRFYRWASHPTMAKADQSQTVLPFDVKDLPSNVTSEGREFLLHADAMGIKFAPGTENNWHLDGWDYNLVMMMSCLWGTYINSLPHGNMGNLIVYPGTHHVLAKHLRDKGPDWMYDGKKQKPTPQEKWPKLCLPKISDGLAYQLCVEAGDIVLAHPWLAHGIGVNTSKQTRLACYARLSAKPFWWPPEKCYRRQIAGQSLGKKPWIGGPKKWKGDYLAGLPGLNKWVKNNRNLVDEYDGGVLSVKLEDLKLSFKENEFVE